MVSTTDLGSVVWGPFFDSLVRSWLSSGRKRALGVLSKDLLLCRERPVLRGPSSAGARPTESYGENSARAAAEPYCEGLKTEFTAPALGFSTCALAKGIAPTCLYGSADVEAEEASVARAGSRGCCWELARACGAGEGEALRFSVAVSTRSGEKPAGDLKFMDC